MFFAIFIIICMLLTKGKEKKLMMSNVGEEITQLGCTSVLRH